MFCIGADFIFISYPPKIKSLFKWPITLQMSGMWWKKCRVYILKRTEWNLFSLPSLPLLYHSQGEEREFSSCTFGVICAPGNSFLFPVSGISGVCKVNKSCWCAKESVQDKNLKRGYCICLILFHFGLLVFIHTHSYWSFLQCGQLQCCTCVVCPVSSPFSLLFHSSLPLSLILLFFHKSRH